MTDVASLQMERDRLRADVKRCRAEIAEWTNAARKVFRGPQDAKTREEYDRRHEQMERDGLAELEGLMLGNGWANLESESTMAHMARQIEAANAALAEQKQLNLQLADRLAACSAVLGRAAERGKACECQPHGDAT